jgi:hypothetical protein
MPVASVNTKSIIPFTPQSISGLNMWLDASDANTLFTNSSGTSPVSENGDSIAAWKDKSPNGYLFSQVSTAKRPIYTKNGLNGLSVMSYDGEQYLRSATSIPFYTTNSSGGSFFVVFKTTSTANQRFLMFYQNTTIYQYCDGSTELGYTTGNGTPGNFGVHNGCGNATVAQEQIVENTYVMMNLNLGTSETAPANVTVYKNGSQQGVNNDNNGFYSAGSYPASNNARYLIIGARLLFGYTDAESIHIGTIAELIWFKNPVTAQQQQQIEGYLSNKWGLQSALPATHPYTTNYLATVSGLVWKDKSSAENHMSLISGNPTYSQTTKAVNIPSGTILETTNYVDVTRNITSIFVVCEATSVPSGLGYVFACPDLNDGDSSIRFYPNTTTLNDGFGGTTFYVNGSSYASESNTLRSGYNIIYAMPADPTGHSGSTRFSISSSFFGRYFVGNIHEVIVYTSAITSTERQQVETYLSSKWNIAVATAVSGLTTPTSIADCSLWLDGADASTFITQTFVPTDIYGCAFWLDGSDTSSMTFSGSSITQWNDKSGNGHHATVASGKTAGTYSSEYKAVDFPASTTGYVTSYPAGAYQETMFVVANNPSPSGNNNIVIGGQLGARSLGFGYSGTNGSTTAVAYLNNEVAWLATTDADSYTPGTTAIVTGYVDYNDTYISINGGAFSSWYGSGFTNGTTTYLGVDTTTSAYYFVGKVMEVIFYNSILDATQTAQVNTYLQQKWNTTFLMTQPSPPFVVRPFIPTDIPNCILWLDAADESSITLGSGISVTSWYDKSGNGNTATVPDTSPLYFEASVNGMGTISFDGSSQFLNSPCTIDTASHSLFVVHNPGSVNSNYTGSDSRLLSFQESLGFIVFPYNYDTRLGYINSFTGGGYIALFEGNVAGVYQLINANIQSGDSATFNNGTLIASSSDTLVSSTSDTLSIGAYGVIPYQQQFYYGSVAEIVIYNTVLTSSQRQQVESYLAWKWGFPGSLPATHPGYALTSFTAQFTPKSISNMSLWLDAADKSTLVMSNSNVSKWYDKSGNGHIGKAMDGANLTLTTQNGNNVVYFPYTRMIIPNFTWNNQFTIFYVCKPVYSAALMGFGSSTASNADWLAYTSPGNWALFYVYNVNGYIVTTDPNYTTAGHPAPVVQANQWVIFSIGYNLGTTVTNYAVNGTERTANSMSSLSAGFQKGVFFINGLPHTAYDFLSLGELLHFNKSLSTTERQKVEGYLAWKWGLNGNLPTTHPYYKFSP